MGDERNARENCSCTELWIDWEAIVKKIPLFKVVNSPEMESTAVEVMRSGLIASGEHVRRFEDGLSDLLGHEHIVSVSDMTSAIYMALHISGVRLGDDVITSAFSCMATNAPISAMGANAIWVDLLESSISIDPVAFERAITPKTKAAILYHVAGYPGAVKEISEICKKHDIVLIEDCNNALLAMVEGEPAGGSGDFAIYSFYPTRLIQTFEGAAIVCRDEEKADALKKLRRLGIDFTTFRNEVGEINAASDIPEAGWASSLSNIGAAIGCVQLSGVKDRIEKVRENAACLSSLLSQLPGLTVIPAYPATVPSYWALLIQVEGRNKILKFLKEKGVHVSSLHQMNDRYSCFHTSSCYELPNTEILQKTILALPCGWWLSRDDIEYIVAMMELALQE